MATRMLVFQGRCALCGSVGPFPCMTRGRRLGYRVSFFVFHDTTPRTYDVTTIKSAGRNGSRVRCFSGTLRSSAVLRDIEAALCDHLAAENTPHFIVCFCMSQMSLSRFRPRSLFRVLLSWLQGGEDVTDEPVREQAIFDPVQGHDRCGLLDEGHRYRRQTGQPAGKRKALLYIPINNTTTVHYFVIFRKARVCLATAVVALSRVCGLYARSPMRSS